MGGWGCQRKTGRGIRLGRKLGALAGRERRAHSLLSWGLEKQLDRAWGSRFSLTDKERRKEFSFGALEVDGGGGGRRCSGVSPLSSAFSSMKERKQSLGERKEVGGLKSSPQFSYGHAPS